MQYYTLGQTYNSFDINVARDADLDRLVSVLGVIRNSATYATGVVRFGRTQPATSDITIPYGRLVSTRPDINGNTVEFMVTDTGKMITAESSYVDVNVRAVSPGKAYISASKLNVMVDPIMGVEYVRNEDIINSGTDKESDQQLRARAKMALGGLGKGTSSALLSAILDVDGVVDVSVSDMARGVGTTDISVVCDTMPAPQPIIDQITAVAESTKAAGIDIQIKYPTVVQVDISFTMQLSAGYDHATVVGLVVDAINKYISSLGIGGTVVRNKLLSSMMGASDGIIDITLSSPSANVTCTSLQIPRVGMITADGVPVNG
jgi:uncharacterized phage protein gp47/JayE